MNNFVLAAMVITLLALPQAFAQEEQGELVKPISPAEARKMIGTNAVIVGKVAEVHKTAKVIRLNLTQKYPNQEFTAVVFARDFRAFTNFDTLEGKTIELSGKVEEYRGRPEMILHTKGQLRVLEGEKPTSKPAPQPKGGDDMLERVTPSWTMPNGWKPLSPPNSPSPVGRERVEAGRVRASSSLGLPSSPTPCRKLRPVSPQIGALLRTRPRLPAAIGC